MKEVKTPFINELKIPYQNLTLQNKWKENYKVHDPKYLNKM